MSDRYYAETAYDSTRPRILPPGDNSRFGLGTRTLRERPLNTRGAHCREYLALDDVSIIEALNDQSPEGKKGLEEFPGHEYLAWAGLNNPAVFIGLMTWASGFLLFGGGVPLLLFSIYHDGIFSVFSWPILTLIGPIISIYTFGKLILRHNLVKNKNNTLLNRCTGLVTIPRKKGPLEIPFDEFDPYLTTITNPTGSTNFCLHLGHRYSEVFVQFPGSFSDLWAIYQNWEYWQQYMDISKPLPDAPRMEPYRSRDPVTAEFDRKQGRPGEYWKNLDTQTASLMIRASVKAVSRFPWGAIREQALAMGWRPSGYGEGPSTRMPSGMVRMPLKKKSPEEAPPPYEQAVIESRGDFENL